MFAQQDAELLCTLKNFDYLPPRHRAVDGFTMFTGGLSKFPSAHVGKYITNMFMLGAGE